MKKVIALDCLVTLFIILFVYTSVDKFINYSLFKEQLRQVSLFSKAPGLIAISVPTIEIIIALMLLFKMTKQLGIILFSSLMLVFTLYIIALMVYSADLPCTCGGFISELSWEGHIIFNSIFLLLSVFAYRLSFTIKRISLQSAR